MQVATAGILDRSGIALHIQYWNQRGNTHPSDIAGIFEIRCGRDVIWERGEKKGMPEIKELKQKVRDVVAPDKDLGHIDNIIPK